MKVIRYYSVKKCQPALAMVLPRQIVDVVCYDNEEEIVAKDARTVTTDITIEWDGKNIVKMDAKSSNDITSTTTYEYDGKLNPYAGFYCGEEVGVEMYSKNNVIKTTTTRKHGADTDEATETVEYEYDGKVPTTVKTTSVSKYGIGDKHTVTMVTTDTYEFVK
ncbi:MAG: hypothetical protein J6T63_08080 [Bacteroidales bacterium]|nr:hypothetical protein [Bacteroidales bacterium]